MLSGEGLAELAALITARTAAWDASGPPGERGEAAVRDGCQAVRDVRRLQQVLQALEARLTRELGEDHQIRDGRADAARRPSPELPAGGGELWQPAPAGPTQASVDEVRAHNRSARVLGEDR
jgi:hypothetical protein